MALHFQYLEIDGVEFGTYWQNGGYKKISDIIFAECHIFIVSNLCYGHPLTTWFVGKFYTHTPPPLFKPPRYGPEASICLQTSFDYFSKTAQSVKINSSSLNKCF